MHLSFLFIQCSVSVRLIYDSVSVSFNQGLIQDLSVYALNPDRFNLLSLDCYRGLFLFLIELLIINIYPFMAFRIISLK